MASNTFVALDKKTVSSAVASVTFSGFDSAYTDLIVVGSVGVTAAADVLMTFNGDSTSGLYSFIALGGDGTTASQQRYTNRNNIQLDYPGYAQSTLGGTNFIINLQGYSGSSFKATLLRFSNGSASAGLGTNIMNGIWRNTNAITSVTLTANGTTFLAGSTFSLYGVKAWAAEATPKATGGYVYSDSSYWYHAFPFSGTFTPAQSLTCDYLLIAGGGGGGGDMAGGGGAGGLRSTVTATGGLGTLESAVTLTSGTAYTVTIGAGGAAQFTDSSNGYPGSNSSISGTGLSTLTAIGGGYGGYYDVGGGAGGSGGGAGRTPSGGGGTRTASPVQGFNGGGGSGSSGTLASAGGGGGAGAVGANGSTSGAGAGGNGLALPAFATATFTGVNSYYAGGGGGGAYDAPLADGGLGGGGGGGKSGLRDGLNAVAATGSGGGGGGPAGGNGGAGGSGLVIIRYAK